MPEILHELSFETPLRGEGESRGHRIGTCGMLKFAVSKTKILLGVPEERLHSLSHRVNVMKLFVGASVLSGMITQV